MNRYKFTVNDNYAVRFGMGAIKGVGSGQSQRLLKTEKMESTNRF
jgi:DNA polymerase-3 subunit alpha